MQCDDKEEYTFAVPRLPHPPKKSWKLVQQLHHEQANVKLTTIFHSFNTLSTITILWLFAVAMVFRNVTILRCMSWWTTGSGLAGKVVGASE